MLRDGGQWRYHSVVREQMVRYLQQKSPQRWVEVHGKLAAFYQTRRLELGLEVGKEAEDKQWRDYSLEWIYHELCSGPQRNLRTGLNGFLVMLKRGPLFGQQWTTVMGQAGEETGCAPLKQWGNQLESGLVDANENRHEKNLANFSSLIAEPQVEEQLKAIAFARRGQTYRLMGRYNNSLKDFDRAIELDERYYWAIASRGRTYQKLKRYEDALKDFDRAIELDNKYAGAVASRGETYQKLKRYEDALKDFDRAIELDERYTWAIVLRGETYRKMKRYDEALQDFNRAIKLDDQYTWVISQRGQTLHRMKRYDEALDDFNRAIKLDEKYTWAIVLRGQNYRAMRRYDKALIDFSRAIELDESPTWTVIGYRGETYRLMKRYDEALIDFSRAIELNDKCAGAIWKRGEIYLKTNQTEKSIQDFDRAIELDPETQWCYYLRALAYQKLNQPEAATADIQQAITIAQAQYEKDPTKWWNTFNLALYHLTAGHQAESDRLYNSSLTAPTEWIEMAIDDLDDFLELFPDRAHAQQVRQQLQGTITTPTL